MPDTYSNLGAEQFKQGIFNFLMAWVQYNNQVAGIEADASHNEPVAWLRELCDSLEEQQSKQHTKEN